MSKETVKNLEALRSEMRRLRVDAVIIPGTDPHQSEYISGHWKLRDWVSGFTGSNGTAVVTMDEAGLWTDSRYFLQAAAQLDGSGFVLHKEDVPGEATVEEWIAGNLHDGAVLAVDGYLFSIARAAALEEMCGRNGLRFASDFDIADRVWIGGDRPGRPSGKVFIHEEKYAGESANSKIDRVLAEVEKVDAESIFIPSLDEIAWTLNLRGSDVEFTPVFISYLYLSRTRRVLFIDEVKLDDEVRSYLKSIDVEVKPYDGVKDFLSQQVSTHETILLDPSKMSDTLARALDCMKVYAPSPVSMLKAVKNDVQLAGTRKAMERDGAALVRLFMWLEENAATGKYNEIDVWKKGMEFRGQSELYRGDSFSMIAGYKEHGAIVHYSATEESASTLAADGLLLIDSGAQYLDGTTDITRTLTLGNPTADERHDYTLVLKGHLAIARAQFPVGTRGSQLDALARIYLWEEGMGYLHGTGHGVGHFLGVHEGPQNIRLNENPTTLQPGMITSDEPGVYKTGRYGIRIENLVLTVPGAHSEEFGDFCRFEVLTLFPYDNKLIDTAMLTRQEIDQINSYHKQVYDRLSPYLNEDECRWLADKTREL